jgi:hypothetical protein
MATMSVRGIDPKALARLKRQAEREGTSVNALVLRLLGGEPAERKARAPLPAFDDLDALTGSWSSAQLRGFERATAPFREVDPALWK